MDFYYKASSVVDSLRILVVADVDSASASKLAEVFVPNPPQIDLILLLGPFTHKELVTPEELALAEAEIGCIIAQLENIVCRVVYLGTEHDPTRCLTEQLHLTPNSVNIHARRLPIHDGLYTVGFSETRGNLEESALPDDVDRSPESDDELEGVKIQSSKSSVGIIEDLFFRANEEEEIAQHESSVSPIKGKRKKSMGIFCFNYKYAHTLSHVLFHMPEKNVRAGVTLAIIPSVQPDQNLKIPQSFGKLNIVSPKSMKNSGQYTILQLDRNASNGDESGLEWSLKDTQYYNI